MKQFYLFCSFFLVFLFLFFICCSFSFFLLFKFPLIFDLRNKIYQLGIRKFSPVVRNIVCLTTATSAFLWCLYYDTIGNLRRHSCFILFILFEHTNCQKYEDFPLPLSLSLILLIQNESFGRCLRFKSIWILDEPLIIWVPVVTVVHIDYCFYSKIWSVVGWLFLFNGIRT